MLSPAINADCLCFFCCIERLLLVLDVFSVSTSHFVTFEGFRLIKLVVHSGVSLFFFTFCTSLRDMVKHELRVATYELQVESSKARVEIQNYEFRFTSYDFKSTSYELKFTSYKFKSTSYEFKSAS